jgi:hypothetical protein
MPKILQIETAKTSGQILGGGRAGIDDYDLVYQRGLPV